MHTGTKAQFYETSNWHDLQVFIKTSVCFWQAFTAQPNVCERCFTQVGSGLTRGRKKFYKIGPRLHPMNQPSVISHLALFKLEPIEDSPEKVNKKWKKL
jgi:hypothetical protein